MYNPLCLFSERLLDAFVKANKKYFIRQGYPRGFNLIDNNIKRYFLISHYGDLNQAKQHFDAIRTDGNRYLYDWDNAEDQKRLRLAVTQPDGFKIFAAVMMPDWKARAEVVLKEKMQRFIRFKLKWFPSKNDSVDFELSLNYGEVFVTMKLRNQQIEVSLADVENFK